MIFTCALASDWTHHNPCISGRYSIRLSYLARDSFACFLKKYIFIDLRDRKRNIDWLPTICTPDWGSNLQPRYVPWPKLNSQPFGVWDNALTNQTTPAGAVLPVFEVYKQNHTKGEKIFFIFRLNLLGWQWLIKLHRSQVYNSIVHHLYIVLCAHHPKSGVLPSPLIPTIPLLPPPPAKTQRFSMILPSAGKNGERLESHTLWVISQKSNLC